MKNRKRYRRKILGYLVGRLIQALLRLILSTCKIDCIDHANFAERSRKGRFILLMWHNRLPMVEPFLRRFGSPNAYTAVVNQGRRGDIVEGMTKVYKQTKVIRMPPQHNHAALRKVMEALRCNEVVVFAADGDRGPRYEVKPGIAFTSKTAAAPVVPFSFSASSYWQLNTWDRMIIPKPFSTITLGVGAPVQITRDEAKVGCQELEQALLRVDQETLAALPKEHQQQPA